MLEPTPLDPSVLENDPQTPALSGPTNVEAGETHEWIVNGLGSGDTCVFFYPAQEFLAAMTPVAGVATFSLTIPAGTPPGTYALLFTGHDETTDLPVRRGVIRDHR